MKKEIREIDLSKNKLNLHIKDSNIEIISNGDCRNTLVKINGMSVPVTKMNFEIDVDKKTFGKLKLEMYTGVDWGKIQVGG